MRLFSNSRWAIVGAGGILLVVAGFFIVKAAVNPFGQPTNFNAVTASACQINLSWDAQQAASFEIQRSKDSTFFSGVTSIVVPGDVALWNDAPLPTSTTFYYQMRAKNTAGQFSAWSDPSSATTSLLTMPEAPNVTSAVGTSGNKQADVSFSSPVPISTYGGYFIERAVWGTSNFTVLNSGNPLPSNFLSPFSDNNGGAFLDPATAYRYRIRSFESGEGCGNVRAYSPYAEIVVPSLPSGLVANYSYVPGNPTLSHSIALSWNAAKGQNFYEVWKGIDSDITMTKLNQTNSTSFSDTNLPENHKYYYKVRACTNSGGCSDFSNTDFQTVASAPQNLTASIAAVHSGTPGTVDIALSWDNTFPERNYYLERATSTTGTFVPVGNAIGGPVKSVSTVSYSDAALGAGGTYVYRVYAKFGNKNTDYSNLVSVDTNVTPLIGWAWAAADGSGGVPHGIGWIKFDSATAPVDSVAYGVYRNANNSLSGYAWSGIQCSAGEKRSAGSTCGYGWLSFNETSGCPGGSCKAVFDPTTNKLSGWAKFIAADPAKGLWDGWVSLSSLNKSEQVTYAPEYNPSTGKFIPGAAGNTSWAWGSSVTGWVTFYDVSMGAASNIGPVLKSVTNLGCADANNCSVKLQWENPAPYQNIKIMRSAKNQSDINIKGTYIIVKEINSNSEPQNLVKCTSGCLLNTSVSGLEQNSRYGFYLQATQ